MDKRTKVSLLVFCLVVLTTVVLYLANIDNEPYYQGRSLTEWYRLWCSSADEPSLQAQADECAHAIRQMAPEALPVLLKRLSYVPSPARRRATDLVEGLPWRSARNWLLDRLRPDDATGIFCLLGPQAAPAIPELTTLLRQTNSPDLSYQAAYCLRVIGDDAVPAMTDALREPRLRCCQDVTFWLSAQLPYNTATNLTATVPFLARIAQDTNLELATVAIRALGSIRGRPELAVPALCDALKSKSVFVRQDAVRSLMHFGTNAQPAVPTLIGLLSDPSYAMRSICTNAVHEIAPEALTNGVLKQPEENF
jgi:HEAT repeat protein